jgi:formate hydrogenlyase subunit 6/NADH:ubiquinone oxidoreductase subunit I
VRKPKVREVGEALRSLFSRPATVRFPHEPYEAPAEFRGRPEFNEDACIGCGACAEVCPADAIEMNDIVEAKPPVRRFVIHYDICIFCGHCELNCTTKTGITNTPEYDLVTFDRSSLVGSIDRELLLCSTPGCGAVIAPRRQILYVAEQLGVKRYANPTLHIVLDGQLGLADVEGTGEEVVNGMRPDGVKVICPKCRRTTLVKELWG